MTSVAFSALLHLFCSLLLAVFNHSFLLLLSFPLSFFPVPLSSQTTRVFPSINRHTWADRETQIDGQSGKHRQRGKLTGWLTEWTQSKKQTYRQSEVNLLLWLCPLRQTARQVGRPTCGRPTESDAWRESTQAQRVFACRFNPSKMSWCHVHYLRSPKNCQDSLKIILRFLKVS